MLNVVGSFVDGKLVLVIDTSAEARAKAPPSRSGKNLLLASTRSFVLFGDVAVSLNATIAKPEEAGD